MMTELERLLRNRSVRLNHPQLVVLAVRDETRPPPFARAAVLVHGLPHGGFRFVGEEEWLERCVIARAEHLLPEGDAS